MILYKRPDRRISPLAKVVFIFAALAAVVGPQAAVQAHQQYIDNYTFVWVTQHFCVSAETGMTHYDEWWTTGTWTQDATGIYCHGALSRNPGYIKNSAAFFSNGNFCGSYPEQTNSQYQNTQYTHVGFSIAPWCPGHASVDTWNYAAYGNYWYPQYGGGYYPSGAWHDF